MRRAIFSAALCLAAGAAQADEALFRLCAEAANRNSQGMDALIACDRAIATADAAPEELPYWLFLARGVARRAQGDLEGSRQDLDHVMERRPDDAQVVRMIAWNLRETGDAAAAEALYDRAIALEPDHWQGLLSRCVVRLDQGKLEPGLDDCEAALERNPPNQDAHYFTLWTLNELGRHEEAAELAAASLRLADPQARLFEQAVAANIALGRVDTARRQLQQALKAYPGDAYLEGLMDSLN